MAAQLVAFANYCDRKLTYEYAMSWRSFIDGAARVLDLFGTMSPPVDLTDTDQEAFRRDDLALMSDLAAIRAAEQDAEITPESAAAFWSRTWH